jgi:hypothetical protein
MIRKVAIMCIVLVFVSVLVVVARGTSTNPASPTPSTQTGTATTSASATPSPTNRQPTTLPITPFRILTPSLSSPHVRIGLIALAAVFTYLALKVIFEP